MRADRVAPQRMAQPAPRQYAVRYEAPAYEPLRSYRGGRSGNRRDGGGRAIRRKGNVIMPA